ncbi:DHA2 family efflux MFS transporter permease subunit [Pseudooceanicola sp. LIPI14-2-Ac024]|uniref:MDR family MFS transporter n=1 Tax=Pseudooceanicola sp. LIPI14-2-Ac024 TaxID=3344875 RepID=UPI0035D135CC
MTDATPTTDTASRQDDHRHVLVVFGALMLVMLLASLDQTIVSTALPTIAADLGGLEHISWVVTAYMLAATVVTPLYGKLGDLYGRKVVLQSGIVIFLIGSALCGLSQTMWQLTLFRGVQGLGGGGLMVSAMAAIGDIVSPRERGRYQGLTGAVFAVSTVIGPLLGGFIVEHFSWHWIFYINLPLGLLALVVLQIVFTARADTAAPAIDYAGAALLAIGLTALVLLTSLGGHTVAWGSPLGLGLALTSVMALSGFVLAEHRAEAPILPLTLFRNQTFVIAAAVGFIIGISMFGSITYMPLYLQVVKGMSPAGAGMAMTPMMAGVLVTSIGSGQIISATGRYKVFPVLGSAITAFGLFLLSTLDVDTPVWTASAYTMVLGLGIGMVTQVLILAVQNAVDYRDLGAATSGASLFRSMGGALGVSIFGAIFAAGLATQLADHAPPGVVIPEEVNPAMVAAMTPEQQALYVQAYADALQPVYLAAAVIAVLALVLSLLLKEVPLSEETRGEELGEGLALPRQATSLAELRAIATRVSRRENRWQTIQRIADRLDLDLAPDEIWLLIQLARRDGPVHLDTLGQDAAETPAELRAVADRLSARGLVTMPPGAPPAATGAGRLAVRDMTERYRQRLAEVLDRWSPEEHEEAREMLRRFSQALISELPPAPLAA